MAALPSERRSEFAGPLLAPQHGPLDSGGKAPRNFFVEMRSNGVVAADAALASGISRSDRCIHNLRVRVLYIVFGVASPRCSAQASSWRTLDDRRSRMRITLDRETLTPDA
jgi:hypothetical protein